MATYNDTVTRLEGLLARYSSGSASTSDINEMNRLLEEAEGMKSAQDTANRATRLVSAVRGSGGIPLLASGGGETGRPSRRGFGKPQNPAAKAALLGFTPAGQADVTYERDTLNDGRSYRSTLINDEGEMLIDPQQFETISAPEYRQAFRAYIRGGPDALTDVAFKTLQEGTDASGGFLVPEDVLTKIVQRLPTPTRIGGRVTRLSTTRDSVAMPKVNYNADNIYTTGVRVTWTGEVPASTTAARVTDPIFGQIRIPIFTAMMSLPITNDMIEDSSFPIMDYVSSKFQETIDILYDDKALNGTGSGQPAGILSNLTAIPGSNVVNFPQVIYTGNATGLSSDSIIATAFSLPEQYDNNASFVFNKTSTGLALAQLKDANGRYLWGSGLQDSGLAPGWKDRQLLGYDTILSQLMPNVAALAAPIVFGDLTGYYLVQRLSFTIQVLRELYAETNTVLLLGRIRLGGAVAEDWKLKILQVHA